MTWRPPLPEPDPVLLFHHATAIPLSMVGLPAEWRPLARAGEGTTVVLPPPAALEEVSLGAALRARTTASAFDPGGELALATLATLLVRAAGLAPGETTMGPRRAAPSPGAAYPIAVRVLALRAQGLAPGTYHFDAPTAELRCLHLVEAADLFPAMTLGQGTVADAGAVLTLVGDYARVYERYGPRGYRYMLLECGHIAQNLALVGAGLDLDVKVIGGFSDPGLDRLAAAEGPFQHVLYLVAVGARRPPASQRTEP